VTGLACSSGSTGIQPDPSYPLDRAGGSVGASYGSGLTASSASTAVPSSGYGTSPPSTLPNHGSATTNLIARPDLLTLTFALRAVADDADAGVALLEQSAKALEPRFAEVAAKGSMRMRMRGTIVERASKSGKASKTRGDAEPEPFAISLQGTFEYALVPAQDYWARSHELARIAGLAGKVTAASRVEGAPFVASFGLAEPHVRDVETFRPELVQKWSARKRQSARDVKTGEVPLTPETCRLNGDITQHVVSIEEIELTLPIDCRPTVAPPARPGVLSPTATE
jgi:hypothetical protein